MSYHKFFSHLALASAVVVTTPTDAFAGRSPGMSMSRSSSMSTSRSRPMSTPSSMPSSAPGSALPIVPIIVAGAAVVAASSSNAQQPTVAPAPAAPVAAAVPVAPAAQAAPVAQVAPVATVPSNNVPEQTPIEMPQPNRILGELIVEQATLPKVKACFQELSIEEKPLQYMSVTDAKNVVDCTDQKTVNEFINNPSGNRRAVTNVVWQRTGSGELSYAFYGDAAYAQKVTAVCAANGRTKPGDFSACASNVFAGDCKDNRTTSLLALGVMGVLAAFGGAYFLASRKEPWEEMSHKGPKFE